MAKQQMGYPLCNDGLTQPSNEQATGVSSQSRLYTGEDASAACSHLPLGKGQDAMQSAVKEARSG